MTEEEQLLEIECLLSSSDIVWSKLGNDTIEQLARRILKSLKTSVE